MKIIADDVIKGNKSEHLNFEDTAGLFVACLGAVSYTIIDKIAQVGLQSMRTMTTVIDYIIPNSVKGNALFNSYIDQIIIGMM